MDVEKAVRVELIEKISGAFDCIEEAPLKSSWGLVRCDVLARPRHPEFSRYLFAFECKRPSQDWHYAKWARAIKQGIDYVDALPIERSANLGLLDTPVTCSFIFPAPHLVPNGMQQAHSELVRQGYEDSLGGMFHMAMMFRTGKAGIISLTNVKYFALALGPTVIWNERSGFYPKAHDLLARGRPRGSRNI